MAELREHAQIFAARAPGSLRLLRMEAGDASIEVQWHSAPGSDQVSARTQAPPSGGPPSDGQTADDTRQMLVTAPLVGTFYRAPAPGRPPFVEVGDHVVPGQTIGIIEAMKLMNSVVAGQPGRVTEVFADDGQPVEFGQPLIALIPPETDADTPPNGAGGS